MTGERQQQKVKRRCLIPAVVTAALGALTAFGGMSTDAATTERVVTDTLTGLAISGFDPVSYLTESAPRLGLGAYELSYRGAVWRFHNEGNRAAFARDPEVYAPRFGGYDPVALARGIAVPGHPLIWLVHANRLYLFSKPENRRQFAAGLDRAIAAAERLWPKVEKTLVP